MTADYGDEGARSGDIKPETKTTIKRINVTITNMMNTTKTIWMNLKGLGFNV